jgi:hypothetical protein
VAAFDTKVAGYADRGIALLAFSFALKVRITFSACVWFKDLKVLQIVVTSSYHRQSFCLY